MQKLLIFAVVSIALTGCSSSNQEWVESVRSAIPFDNETVSLEYCEGFVAIEGPLPRFEDGTVDALRSALTLMEITERRLGMAQFGSKFSFSEDAAFQIVVARDGHFDSYGQFPCSIA